MEVYIKNIIVLCNCFIFINECEKLITIDFVIGLPRTLVDNNVSL